MRSMTASRSGPSRSPRSGSTPPQRTLRSETVKHYLATIYYIQYEEKRVRASRIAEWLGVSAPTVSVTLQHLAADGWLLVAPDRSVTLSPAGERAAGSIVRVHRLLERWLTDVLGFDWASADAEAQGLAPAMSEAVADRLDAHLGQPSTCPHGNVIPGRRPPYGRLIALADLPPGTTARVRRISEVAEHDAPQLLRQLDGYDLTIDAPVQVAEADASVGALPVEVGGRTIALGTSVAGLIWVEPE